MRLKNLTPIQADVLKDKHRFIVNPAGRRSRKTLIAKRKVLIHALRNTEHKYFHGAPTRQQAKGIFWKELKKYTKPFRTKSPNETELYVTLINGTEIHVVGLDKAERIEGQEWHGCHISEMGKVKPGVWDENISPILADTKGFAILDGVPEGRNHYYDLALYACEGALPEPVEIHGARHYNKTDKEWAYFTWFSSDVLDRKEIENQRRRLDPKTFRQEYEGSFESFEGLAYYTFGQHSLREVVQEPGRTICIGMDFNVDPMTATLGVIESDVYKQWGELYLPNSNTYEMCKEIKNYCKNNEEVIIFPDSTGKARESNATESDIAILRKSGFKVHARLSNPYVKDRVNSVNSLVMDKEKQTRYFVNPKTCPKTINDFNRRERLDDGRLNKEQEKLGIGHITDALGYLVHYNFPVVERTIEQIRV
jgi:hypothetical protein